MSRPTVDRLHAAPPSPWRWAVLGALLATIPAFYVEMLADSPLAAAGWVYGLAACVVAIARWRTSSSQPSGRRERTQRWLDVALVVGLALSAALPTSRDSGAALAFRLLVAGLSLLRMVGIARPWITRGSLHHVLVLSLLILAGCGVGFWLLEPKAHTLSDGLWLAFTTAATVGYGDIVPTTPAAKIFAVFVVLLGYAALSLVTAAIAAVWVESAEREVEREILHELHAEVKRLRADLQALREDVREGRRH